MIYSFLKKLFHFLGGIYFAITLLSLVTIFVIAGTFIESSTDSHQFASKFTYGNPLFTYLLWGFFINILFATLRRWPFRTKHIPFIITHCGLLMILGGSLVKSYYGTQGIMLILEGNASQKLLLPENKGLLVEEKNNSSSYYPIHFDFFGNPQSTISPKIKLLAYTPHAKEKNELWIKGNQLCILGTKLCTVQDENGKKLTPQKTILNHDTSRNWDLFALKTNDVDGFINRIFLEKTSITLRDKTNNNKLIFEGFLKEAIEKPIRYKNKEIVLQLNLHETNPKIGLHWGKESMHMMLSGPKALLPQNSSAFAISSFPITIDIKQIPSLYFLEDKKELTHIWAFDSNGQIFHETIDPYHLKSLFVYDKGFGGYTVQNSIPFPTRPIDRETKEKAILSLLEEELRGIVKNENTIAPPLAHFLEASRVTSQEFATQFMAFLKLWDDTNQWYYPETQILPKELSTLFEKISFNELELRGALWSERMISEFLQKMELEQDLYHLLTDKEWPLAKQLEPFKNTPEQLLIKLSQQIFSVSELLPPMNKQAYSPEEKARLLSVYLKAHGISLHSIMPVDIAENFEAFDHDTIQIETPLTTRHIREEPLTKLEDNKPNIVVEISDASKKKQKVSLLYDKHAAGFKWPVLEGQFLLRFQSEVKDIPYKVRLRQARQISYLGTNQPFSYEADVIVKNVNDSTEIEKTISMNNVHETWDGYRFYLSNISTPSEQESKQVQIVVNHDPGKYYLTYPGGILLALGIVLLFWVKPYRKRE